jgi:hypothetical protein
MSSDLLKRVEVGSAVPGYELLSMDGLRIEDSGMALACSVRDYLIGSKSGAQSFLSYNKLSEL